MEEKELFRIITRVPKWYAGFTSAQNAYNIRKRYEEGKLGFEALEKMFNHYGYQLKSSWEKK